MIVTEVTMSVPHTLVFTAMSECHNFMCSLNLTYGIYTVSREGIYQDVLELYGSDGFLSHYPVAMEFKGELALDAGGVKRDVFATFFEEMYRHLFDGSSLVTPSVRPGVSLDTVATIISHAYLVSAVLPVRIAFPCLAGVLCGDYSENSIPGNILVETLLNSFSHYDALVFLQAREEVKKSNTTFSDMVNKNLIRVLSYYNCSALPTPTNLEDLLLQVATYEFNM